MITADRPSRRTEAEKAEAFAKYLERTEPYFAKISEDGDRPWFGSEDERRDLFDRRYEKPAPPSSLPPIESVKAYAVDGWDPVG
ncbi:hypothetical protein WSS_A15219 [Rhodococcus opacus M213]|uniref:Uncharacterized protein n=1 Tax=Rhodococcus opacus M213 TaxID=1129896 RepID=K8XKB5_RHOOP|nr:hypothetical protein [Rhodococcus opacus]EKT81854.1 hypothetical protein WSS_A15219 [Rhodococcus opacus M213]